MNLRETADDYLYIVVVLNAGWRIIECRDRIQRILQHRGSPEKPRPDDWRGRSYCRTSEALIRCTRLHAGIIDASGHVVLNALPNRFQEKLVKELS
jgi:hypothetical protein